MKQLKKRCMSVKEVREKLTATFSNLAGDCEEIIVTKKGSPLVKIMPIYREEREKLRTEIKSNELI